MTARWWRITITVAPEESDALAAALVAATGHSVEEPRTGVICTIVNSRHDAEQLVRGTRLLTARDMRRLFPDAFLWRERVLGFTKSIVAYGGFDPASGLPPPEKG